MVHLRHRRRRSRRSVFAVSFLDLRAHFSQTLALVDHFHHVTRDVDADASSEAHPIKDRVCRCRSILEITRSVARVAFRATAAIAWDVAKSFAIKNRETVSLADFGGTLRNVRRQILSAANW